MVLVCKSHEVYVFVGLSLSFPAILYLIFLSIILHISFHKNCIILSQKSLIGNLGL